MRAGLQTIRKSQGCTGTVPESQSSPVSFSPIRCESDTCRNCLDLHPAERYMPRQSCVERFGTGQIYRDMLSG